MELQVTRQVRSQGQRPVPRRDDVRRVADVHEGVTSERDEARRVFDRAVDAGIKPRRYGERLQRREERGAHGGVDQVEARSRPPRDQVPLRDRLRDGAPGGPHDGGLSRKAILASCEASLARLKTDYIDLFQCTCQDTSVAIDETLRALDDLVTEGKSLRRLLDYTGYRLVESLWTAEKAPDAQVRVGAAPVVARGARGRARDRPACKQFGLGRSSGRRRARVPLREVQKNQAPPAGTRLESWQESLQAVRQRSARGRSGRPREGRQAARVAASVVAIAWSSQAGDHVRHPRRPHRAAARRTPRAAENNLAEDVRSSTRLEADGLPAGFIGRSQAGRSPRTSRALTNLSSGLALGRAYSAIRGQPRGKTRSRPVPTRVGRDPLTSPA